MSTADFNILVNFCENIYPTDSPINEAWYGLTLTNFANTDKISNSVLSDEDAEKFNVISFANAPADSELKTKYPGGLVYISIPLNMIDRVGMQKYGAYRPGRIIGYNPDKRYALVSFLHPIYEVAEVYHNVYSYKYLTALTNDFFETGTEHTVSSLKRALVTNTKLVFTSSQTLLQGKQLLAEGRNDRAGSILMEVLSDLTSRRRPVLERVEVQCSLVLGEDSKAQIFNLNRHETPVSDIVASIKLQLQLYHDKIADAVSVNTGLEVIKKALTNYPGTSTVTSTGGIEIKYINDTQFNSIEDILGKDYRRENDIEQLRAAIPDTVTAPASAPGFIWVNFYKDVKTAKNFLVVMIQSGNHLKTESDILSPSSRVYKILGKMDEDKNKISEETSDFMAAFNLLTKPGKELFLRYLTHPNA